MLNNKYYSKPGKFSKNLTQVNFSNSFGLFFDKHKFFAIVFVDKHLEVIYDLDHEVYIL